MALVIIVVLLLTSCSWGAEVVVPFETGTAQINDTGDGQVSLEIPGYSTFATPGDPALPYIERFVLLPSNTDLDTLSIEIRSAVEEAISGQFSVIPTPPITTSVDGRVIQDWGNQPIIDGKNPLIYESDQFYPANYATAGYESRLGPYLMVPVRFWPYRYNPVTGELVRLVKGEVALVFEMTQISLMPAPASPWLTEKLETLVVNPELVSESYPQAAAPASAAPLAIITTSNIISKSTKLASFIAHKTNMGFDVTLVTESQWGGGIGNAAAENIRTWLKANYATKARYAILIGNPHPDNGDVPMKMLWPRYNADDYREAPSDYYYADLTGNWDLDGDGIYGEQPDDFGTGGIDRVPEVIIGRIPHYGNTADLDKILQKIINYETSTTVGTWAQRMLIPLEPLDANTPLWQLGELIRTDVAIPSALNYYRIYEENYGVVPAPEKTPCNETNVRNEWKNGYAFVFWGTHGWPQGGADIFTTGSCPSLDDTKPAYTFQGSCLTAYPEASDNLAYSLLKNGGIGTNGATRVSWYYPGQTDYSNTDSVAGMTYQYAKQIAKLRKRSGDALYDSKLAVYMGIYPNHIVFNLYGDPTIVPQWPSTFNIETTSLPYGKVGQPYSVNLQASGGKLPYIWSVVDGSLPGGLTLNSNGTISGTPQTSGFYTVTIRASGADGAWQTREYTFGIKMAAHYFGLDTDPGWTCQGDWAFGKPAGGGSNNHDPISGYTGAAVYGYNLAGDYPNKLSQTQYLTTKAIDCSSLTGSKLVFKRWLGVDIYDGAMIDISNNGIYWTTIWGNTSVISDSSWTEQAIDISSYADGQPTIYLRWGMGPTNSSVTYPGWNIDDIEIEAVLSKPIIKHTPIGTTDATTGYYYITCDIICTSSLLPSNPVLYWKTTDGYTQVVMSSIGGKSYRGAIPAQPLGTVINYYITAADPGGTAYSPATAPTDTYELRVEPDQYPPVIVHTPLPNTKNTTGPYQVKAEVTDNKGISSVVLYWSKNGGSPSGLLMSKTGDPEKPNEYVATISGPAVAGDWFTYKIVAIDSSTARLQTTSPANGWHMFNIIPGPSRIYSFPLDSDPGWTCEGSWAFGRPTGGGSNGSDPTAGTTNLYVYGYNLNGNYTNNMSTTRYLTTTPIDCSNVFNTELKFYKWLGVESSERDHANVQASSGDGSWTELWSNPPTSFCDNYWSQMGFNISGIADGKPNVYIRWGIGPTNSSRTYPGWNIDDVEIWGNLYNPVPDILSLKTMADGSSVTIQSGKVSAVYPGYFYIQENGSYKGLRVAWPEAVTEGAQVTVRGILRTRNGERELVGAIVTQGTIGNPVKPVGMNLKSLGGTDYATPPMGQRAVAGGIGLNNIGTLIKTAGKVTQIGTDYFYIDDGSNIWDGTYTSGVKNIGVRINWPGTGFSKGQFVTITGVSSGFINGTNFIRCILPRRASDIQ